MTMKLVEYIRTKQYLDRIISARDSQRGKLSEKKFAQFASSFEFEIEKLKNEIASFEESASRSFVGNGMLCSSFQRIVPMQTRLGSNIALSGSLKAYDIGPQPQFIDSCSFVLQDAWNSPHESLCEAAA